MKSPQTPWMFREEVRQKFDCLHFAHLHCLGGVDEVREEVEMFQRILDQKRRDVPLL